jgi:hypothetical protein
MSFNSQVAISAEVNDSLRALKVHLENLAVNVQMSSVFREQMVD